MRFFAPILLAALSLAAPAPAPIPDGPISEALSRLPGPFGNIAGALAGTAGDVAGALIDGAIDFGEGARGLIGDVFWGVQDVAERVGDRLLGLPGRVIDVADDVFWGAVDLGDRVGDRLFSAGERIADLGRDALELGLDLAIPWRNLSVDDQVVVVQLAQKYVT